MSGMSKLRAFLLANMGRVIESKELETASGGHVQYSRRLRELREEHGWKILSHHDDATLKPGQYRMDERPPATPPVAFGGGISARLRAQVLDRNGFTCVMCGKTPGEMDPDTGRPVRLHIGHIVDQSLGGKAELSNLRALCSMCNQGAKNVTNEKPSQKWLLAQVRRAGANEQKAVLAFLRKKYGG